MTTFEEGIRAVMLTMDGSDLRDVDPEYLRGQANLLAEMFPMPGVGTSERTDEILSTIRRLLTGDAGLTLTDHVEDVLRRSDIVWSKYGQTTIQQLAAEIVRVVEENR